MVVQQDHFPALVVFPVPFGLVCSLCIGDLMDDAPDLLLGRGT